MIKPIVTYNIKEYSKNNVLRQKTRDIVDFKAEEVVNCIQDLNDTLDDLIKKEGNRRGAIGLSATQIGVDLNMSAVTLGNNRYIIINPKLEQENGKKRLFRIGCFSLYKYRAMVYYNDDVEISYYDSEGKKCFLALQGDKSCVVQHEMDHLVGDLLFERLENKEKDLFIPRESMYKDGKIPFRNRGLIYELRRKIGINKIISFPVFYSSLFNDYTDYRSYVDKELNERKQLFEIIKKYAKNDFKLFEYGYGTSAIAVGLNRKGYRIDNYNPDNDMRELAIRINNANNTNVNYLKDTSHLDNNYQLSFSYELLETLNDDNLQKMLKKLLKISKILVFEVPTIKYMGNSLKGNERLRSVNVWINQLKNANCKIIETAETDNGYKVIFVATKNQ